jgi:hypothetical protein
VSAIERGSKGVSLSHNFRCDVTFTVSTSQPLNGGLVTVAKLQISTATCHRNGQTRNIIILIYTALSARKVASLATLRGVSASKWIFARASPNGPSSQLF